MTPNHATKQLAAANGRVYDSVVHCQNRLTERKR